nr:uncharacterized protein LOC110076640 isoform X2 [Pogona vitticeps]
MDVDGREPLTVQPLGVYQVQGSPLSADLLCMSRPRVYVQICMYVRVLLPATSPSPLPAQEEQVGVLRLSSAPRTPRRTRADPWQRSSVVAAVVMQQLLYSRSCPPSLPLPPAERSRQAASGLPRAERRRSGREAGCPSPAFFSSAGVLRLLSASLRAEQGEGREEEEEEGRADGPTGWEEVL